MKLLGEPEVLASSATETTINLPMKHGVAPDEMQQIRVALERSPTVENVRMALFVFWGLIFAKCFAAEWLARVYEAPLNTLYVWIPSVMFGALCTVAYATHMLKEWKVRALTGHLVAAIWTACAMAAVLISLVGTASGVVPVIKVPAFLAVIMGVGFFIHSVLDPRFWFKPAAYGWWVGSVLLFINPGVNAFGWFALMIILFQVLPTVMLWREGR